MRVAHLASSGELGGAEWVILDALTGLGSADPHCHLNLIVPANGPLAERAQAAGIPVTILEWERQFAQVGDAGAPYHQTLRLGVRGVRAVPAAIRYGRRLRQALQSLQPTIVHAHGLKMQLLATWSRPSAIPLVLHLHDYVGARRFASQLLRVRVPRRAVAVAISRSVAADADTVFRGRLPIRVVHNGVDLDYWSGRGAATDLDAACGLPPAPSGTVRVGLVATMARWKGHGVFLEAIAKLANELPVRGYVIGGSIYQTQGGQTSEPELRRVAASLGIGDRVGFTGFLGDPAAAMRALDVVVHASTRPEPFGRVVVEGMALGRAVVTSGTGGSAELIIPGLTALTFRAGDALDLADRLATLIRDPQLRAALGREGVLHASRHFGCSAMIAGLLAAYRYAMASTGGREGGEERDGGVMVDAG